MKKNKNKNKFAKKIKILLSFNRNTRGIRYCEAKEIIKNNPTSILLDIRSIQEYNEYHLRNAINIPLYELKIKANKILRDKNRIIIIYCQSGIRSKRAYRELKRSRI